MIFIGEDSVHSAENKTKQGVTIIVWLSAQEANPFLSTSSGATIISKNISFGHAALRTYSGGANGNGRYLSFFGGSSVCPCCYKDRELPHFHMIDNDDEDCYGDAVRMGMVKRHEIHLGIVNIEAVNQKIVEIFRSKGKVWAIQQNCSDLVLEALRAGVPNFSSRIYQRPYGWKTGAFFTLISMPFLFILRHFFDDWNAASVENEFVQKFFSVLKLPGWDEHYFNTLTHLILAPTIMKWLLLSASKTIRIPGKLNPTFQEAHIYWCIKNLPITFFHLQLPEKEQKLVESVIHFLALDFIKDREVQQFFAHFMLSWEAREENIKKNIIPHGALINAHLTGLWSILG